MILSSLSEVMLSQVHSVWHIFQQKQTPISGVVLHKGLTNKVLLLTVKQLYVHIAFNKVLLHFYAAFNAVKWCWYIFTEKLGTYIGKCNMYMQI